MKLDGYVPCTVQKSLPSSNVMVKGQRSKVKVTRGQKTKSAAFCSEVVLLGAVIVWHSFRERSSGRGPLRRWENQRMLSSL